MIVFNPLSSFFNIKDDGIFNLALIVPYVTEVVFNSVIFYYNFIQQDSGGDSVDNGNNRNSNSN